MLLQHFLKRNTTNCVGKPSEQGKLWLKGIAKVEI